MVLGENQKNNSHQRTKEDFISTKKKKNSQKNEITN